MGYYTNYYIQTNLPMDNPEEKLECLAKNIFPNADYTYVYEDESLKLLNCGILDTPIYNLFSERLKWYSHDRYMIDLSELYPASTWILYGIGEDPLDFWFCVYKNGKILKQQKICKIEWSN